MINIFPLKRCLVQLSVVLIVISQGGVAQAKESDVNSLEANKVAVNRVVDELHDAADKGDRDRYLGLFSEDAVFMGTDDWERWPLQEFTGYVDKRFKDGKGWSYQSLERHVNFSGNGKTAWFDEILYSKKWGRFRGTGVLMKEHEGWKIAHYSMSILIPNEAWEEISKIATQTYKTRDEAKQ